MRLTIRPGTSADAGPVAELIAEAFSVLPVTEWLVAPPYQDRVLGRVFGIHTDHAAQNGLIHLIDGPIGLGGPRAAAVWLPTGHGAPEPEQYEARLATAAGPWADRFKSLDAAMHAAHPRNAPHHHLAFLAVRPGQQRAGLGSALLRHHHRQLDLDGTPAYLEASSPESRDLYLRHGYQPHREPFTVPGGPSPTMWPMWRPAGHDATETR